jgi:flavin reductase (DIM6/NTAB) family NADH-FMN oxidoreductase RutF
MSAQRVRLGRQNVLYPTPTVIVGTHVGDRPNFITIAHIGILNHGSTTGRAELISIGVNKAHYSNAGIREHGAFSVNIPSEDLVAAADCCGIVSGRNADKASLFTLFYGEVPAAPMIEECPLNMECRLHDVYDTATHDVFIGEVVATYARDDALTGGAPDLAKVRPLLFDMSSRTYWSLGAPVGGCWQVGKELKGKLKGK